MKQICLIEGFHNMCVICYNGVYGGDTWQVFTGTRGRLGQHACVGGGGDFFLPRATDLKDFLLYILLS